MKIWNSNFSDPTFLGIVFDDVVNFYNISWNFLHAARKIVLDPPGNFLDLFFFFLKLYSSMKRQIFTQCLTPVAFSFDVTVKFQVDLLLKSFKSNLLIYLLVGTKEAKFIACYKVWRLYKTFCRAVYYSLRVTDVTDCIERNVLVAKGEAWTLNLAFKKPSKWSEYKI